MEILNQIATKGKAFAAWVKALFDEVESPTARLAILAIAALMIFALIWKALPILIFAALIGGAVWLIAALTKEDKL